MAHFPARTGKPMYINKLKILSLTLLVAFFILIINIPRKTTYEADITPAKAVETEQDKIDILIDAIQEFEGFYAGSLAHENNNPCNLRYSPLQSGKNKGFSYFDDYDTGRKGCRHQIEIAANGTSHVYTPDMNLLQFFNTYAPASDSNQPSVYYKFVIEKTGFDEDMLIHELLPKQNSV